MALNDIEYTELEALVNGNQKDEVRCGELLAKAPEFLFRDSAAEIDTLLEDRSYFGDSDIIVAADVRTGMNRTVRVAYIWELKAPQCFLMESDENKNRYRPTKDLIKAENQLLHYSYYAAADGRLRERLKVVEGSKIQPGGIIIGRSSGIATGVTSKGDAERAQTSLSIREEYFYSKNNIRILTWDYVLPLVRPNIQALIQNP